MSKTINRKGNYELGTRFDSRQSFYGKARVELYSDNSEILWSYSTPVACCIKGKIVVRGQYSQTTTRHIKEFIKQHNQSANNLKEVLKLYYKKDFKWDKFLKERGIWC